MGYWDDYPGDRGSVFATAPMHVDAMRLVVALMGDARRHALRGGVRRARSGGGAGGKVPARP